MSTSCPDKSCLKITQGFRLLSNATGKGFRRYQFLRLNDLSMIRVHEASNSRARNLDDRGHTRAVSVKRRLRAAGVCLMQIEVKYRQQTTYFLSEYCVISCS